MFECKLSCERHCLLMSIFENTCRYGQQIPADVRILWATDDMAVDNSSLTGEAEAIRRCVYRLLNWICMCGSSVLDESCTRMNVALNADLDLDLTPLCVLCVHRQNKHFYKRQPSGNKQPCFLRNHVSQGPGNWSGALTQWTCRQQHL